MKPWLRWVLGGVLVLPLAGLSACQTGSERLDERDATTPLANPALMPDEQLIETVDHPLAVSTQSAAVALGELGLLHVQSVTTGRTGLVTAETMDGRAVSMTLRQVAPYRTECGIAISGPNDPAMAGRIKDHLLAALGRGGMPLPVDPLRAGQRETDANVEGLPQQ